MPRRREIDRRALRSRLVRIAELLAGARPATVEVQLATIAENLRALSEDLGMPEIARALEPERTAGSEDTP